MNKTRTLFGAGILGLALTLSPLATPVSAQVEQRDVPAQAAEQWEFDWGWLGLLGLTGLFGLMRRDRHAHEYHDTAAARTATRP